MSAVVPQHIEVGGTRMRVSIRGRGRPLLLINGIGATFELMDPLRRELAAVESIAVDLPGSGESPPTRLPMCMRSLARLVASLLDALGYPQVDVLGVSWGGALAQELALRHPARVRRLVLAATGPGWLGVPGRLSAIRALATPRRYYSPGYFERIAPTLYGGAIVENPRLLGEQGHLRFIHPPSVRGYLWQLAAISCWTSLPRLHHIVCPTLVLAADDDPIVPLANGRIIARCVPRARLHVIARGGHLFLITHAADVAPVITDFLAEA